MPYGYLWTKRPKSDVEMQERVYRLFGPSRDIIGPDGIPVRVNGKNAYAHFWRDNPERWQDLPLVIPAIRNAKEIRREATHSKTRLYPTSLTVTTQGKAGQQAHFTTYVHEDKRGRRYWKTTFQVTKKELEKRKNKAVQVVWPSRPQTESRNPTPARPHAGVSRSGRTLHAYSQYTTRAQKSARWKPLLIVGALLAFTYLALRPSPEVSANVVYSQSAM